MHPLIHPCIHNTVTTWSSKVVDVNFKFADDADKASVRLKVSLSFLRSPM